LIFLGRIHPDKGVHLAIEVARLSGMRLIIAGIVQDEAYFREQIKPHLDDQNILYIGPVDVTGKNELFARARALLHLNTIPERFGLVLVEANAAGLPVIAMDLGSCREVIKDGETGFLVANVAPTSKNSKYVLSPWGSSGLNGRRRTRDWSGLRTVAGTRRDQSAGEAKGSGGWIVEFGTAKGIACRSLSPGDECLAGSQNRGSHGHPRSSHGSGGSPCSSGRIVEFGRRGRREAAIYVKRGAAASD
jgi:glycosyl transferase family 1